jgi:uncharacterized OsmC-like protein
VYFKIDADIPEEKKQELIAMAAKYSPVYNTVANPVPVEVLLDEGQPQSRKTATA